MLQEVKDLQQRAVEKLFEKTIKANEKKEITFKVVNPKVLLINYNTRKSNIRIPNLSETNNTPDIALNTVKDVFKEYEVKFKNISCGSQNEISEVIEL